ncbi:hypothetical protein [Myroides odoratus]|uniref:hypothetical protein n=1 Tax=Myroides odoratus TaxID=256 RepID=UPI0039AF7191
MKNFIMLFLLVFGVNTAIQAQTRAQFTDVRSGAIQEYQFERSISKDDVKAIMAEGQRISPSSSNYGGSFTLYLGVYDRNRGMWDIYEGIYHYPINFTFADIIRDLINRYLR